MRARADDHLHKSDCSARISDHFDAMLVKQASLSESARLLALEDGGLMTTAFDKDLDGLTSLVSHTLKVPVALISLVDQHRQFFKSQCGLPEPWASRRETPLSHSFCQHVVVSGEPFIVNDARVHPLVLDNLATPDIGVIAYAGVPIIGADDYVLGSLCAIDTVPREWKPSDIELLRAFSLQVSTYTQLHARSIRLAKELAQAKGRAAERQATVRFNVHDLRTPLAAMLSAMDLVGMLGPLSPDQARILAMGKRNGTELVNLVNDMLDIDGVEQRGEAALDRAPVESRKLVTRALDQVRALACANGVSLSEEQGSAPPLVMADENKIVRVLVNLLANGIKFTKKDGEVSVRTHGGQDGMVHFAVTDTGIGIAEGADIFEEGVRIDEHASSSQSSGLGLAYCKRIVKAHGGQIDFTSNPGQGSVFTFSLPADDRNSSSQ